MGEASATVAAAAGWGAALFSLSVASWSSVRNFAKFRHYEDAYVTERRGRTRVEKEMKNMRAVRLQTGEESGGAFFVQPIGVVESCYKQCIGTPRQGSLVPSSRSVIHLKTCISPEALDGLDGFSHVWLSFKFHLNSNILDESKAFQGVDGSNQKFTFTAKITPPMLKKKVGVLSTRSPHRPNPIGITLARIEKIDKRGRCLHVSACDLVQETPILDIKPYVSSYDSIQNEKVPDWISATIDTRNKVSLPFEIVQDSIDLVDKYSKLYKKIITPCSGKVSELNIFRVVETLEADVRSKFQTKKAVEGHEKKQVFDLPFDRFNVRYEWRDDRNIDIVGVERDREREKIEGKRGIRKEEKSKKEVSDETMKTCRVAKRFQNSEE